MALTCLFGKLLKTCVKSDLQNYLESNDNINEIFNHTDPNTIAKILVEELSIIVESIAPSKIIQYNKKFVP